MIFFLLQDSDAFSQFNDGAHAKGRYQTLTQGIGTIKTSIPLNLP